MNAANAWRCSKRMDFTHEKIIDRETLLELEPAIAPHVTGGIWVERDGYALPFRTTTAFRLAAERHGAVFHEGTPVTRIEQQGRALVRAYAERVFSPPRSWWSRPARGRANSRSKWASRCRFIPKG